MTDATTRPVVLVVEADAEVREAMSELLREEGYSAVPSASGHEARRVLATMAPPGLILLDLGLTTPGGAELLTWLRADAVHSAVPVVALTAERGPLPPGTVAAFHKPCRVETLLVAIAARCK